MERKERCTECYYWISERKNEGECRVNPPIVTTESEYWKYHWPKTLSTEWCGKFEERKRGGL